MDSEQTYHKVVFLDRDGVINRNSADYIKSRSEFEFLSGSLEAIKLLSQNGFVVIVITNQSVINRNMVAIEELEQIHRMMTAAVRNSGGEIKDIFYCPHTPQDRCDCRKPLPGLILQAGQKYRIDIETAIMVGDSAKDIECARNAGCGRAVLVQTGNGITDENILKTKNIFPDHVARDLLDAAKWIITKDNDQQSI